MWNTTENLHYINNMLSSENYSKVSVSLLNFSQTKYPLKSEKLSQYFDLISAYQTG